MAGGYKHQTVGTPDALPAEIRKLRSEIVAVRRALTSLGIQIDPTTNTVVIGSGQTIDIVGDLDVAGNMAVTGTLSLPAGIIDNAALANPVSVGVLDTQTADTITYGTSPAAVLSGTIAVPSGFSQALVMAVSTALGFLNVADLSQQCDITAYVSIGGSNGPTMLSNGNGNGTPGCQVNASHAALLTGVSGTISVKLEAWGDYNAGGTGTASLCAIATFLR